MSLLKIGAGERMRDITLKLFPAATISGRIIDSEGDPITGAAVNLWAQRRRGKLPFSKSDESTSNSNGEYRFDGLLPGVYYVSAESEASEAMTYAVRQVPVDSSGKATRIHDLTTFYPAALSLSDAQSMTVGSGDELADVDIHIQRGLTPSVKGRIAGFIRSSGYELSADAQTGLEWAWASAKILPDGSFVFEALPPGKHKLVLLQHGPNGPQEMGFTEIDLANEDLTGVVVRPFKQARVSVQVALEGERDKLLTSGTVSLIPVDETTGASSGYQQYRPENGTYIIDGVSPGRYRIWFNNAREYYLKSVQSGSQSVDPGSIVVGDGATLDLRMLFSGNVASIAGNVDVSPGDSNGPIQVWLAAEEPSAEFDKYRVELDQYRHFSIERMRPGKYLAFAVADDDFSVWDNPDFITLLKNEGTELELHESEHATVHLKLIPKKEIDRLKRQLGIK